VNKVDTEEEDDESSSVEDIYTVDVQVEVEEVHVVEMKNKLFAYMDVVRNQTRSKFQLDSGATCNVINKSNVPETQNIEETKKILVMYNQTRITPLGQCKVRINNPKDGRKYRVNFIVVADGVSDPLLGWKAMKQMNLVTVNYANVMTDETTENPCVHDISDNHESVLLSQK
jgi:hypothetical protein